MESVLLQSRWIGKKIAGYDRDMQQIAIYDMDKTITRAPTWTWFLIFATRRLAGWRLVLLPVLGVVTAGYAVGLVGRGSLKELAQRLMLGRAVDSARLAAVTSAFADRVMAGGVYPAALEQIAADRARGCRLVLATASFRYYVEPIARALGMDDVVATESLHDPERRLLARIDGDNCYGAAKLVMVDAWMTGQGIARADAFIRFYSDHVSDVPTLEWADGAFAVNPHAPLRAVAHERGWRVLDW